MKANRGLLARFTFLRSLIACVPSGFWLVLQAICPCGSHWTRNRIPGSQPGTVSARMLLVDPLGHALQDSRAHRLLDLLVLVDISGGTFLEQVIQARQFFDRKIL